MSASQPPQTPCERFAEYLQSHRKRRTPERFAILERMLKVSGHVSADDLCEIMRADGYPVAPATVYATLDLLVDCGLVARRRFSDRSCLYEKMTSAVRHHHLICTCCGKIKEVRDAAITALVESSRFTGFSQSYYTLDIYGICGACARRRRRSPGKSKNHR